MDRKQRSPRGRPKIPHRTHPIYGDIPLITREITVQGQQRLIHDYDPNFAPVLPPGAVRGDIRKQNIYFAHNVPMYFYVDAKQACVQCGQSFIFSAREQKYWYEALGFHGNSVAIRCPRCRRRQRSEKAISAQIASAKSTLKTNPMDAAALLALAEAIVRYHQRTGNGDLEEAIAAARRVRKLVPEISEAIFWEALSHIQAERLEKGRELLRQFIASRPGHSRRDHDHLKAARNVLASFPSQG